jgi:hypothetical protein
MRKVADLKVKLRDTEEVLPDFFVKVAEEDAMLLGRKLTPRVVRGKS